jgi:hypothetical protein
MTAHPPRFRSTEPHALGAPCKAGDARGVYVNMLDVEPAQRTGEPSAATPPACPTGSERPF